MKNKYGLAVPIIYAFTTLPIKTSRNLSWFLAKSNNLFHIWNVHNYTFKQIAITKKITKEKFNTISFNRYKSSKMTQTAPTTLFLAGTDVISVENLKSPTPTRSYPKRSKQKSKYQFEIVWRNVIGFVILHSLALYGLLFAIKAAKLITVAFSKYAKTSHRVFLRFP